MTHGARTLRVGVIGAGLMGVTHLEAWAAEGVPTIVFDVDSTRAAAAAGRFGAAVAGSVDDLLARSDIVDMDHVVHLADVYRLVLDSDVAEVSTVANRILHGNVGSVETGGLLSLRFESGAIATIDCSWSKPDTFPTWGEFSIQVIATQGTVSLNAFRQQLAVYGDRDQGTSWRYWGTDASSLMLAEFLAPIRDDRQPAITAIVALRALEVVDAACRSITTGAPAPVQRHR